MDREHAHIAMALFESLRDGGLCRPMSFSRGVTARVQHHPEPGVDVRLEAYDRRGRRTGLRASRFVALAARPPGYPVTVPFVANLASVVTEGRESLSSMWQVDASWGAGSGGSLALRLESLGRDMAQLRCRPASTTTAVQRRRLARRFRTLTAMPRPSPAQRLAAHVAWRSAVDGWSLVAPSQPADGHEFRLCCGGRRRRIIVLGFFGMLGGVLLADAPQDGSADIGV